MKNIWVAPVAVAEQFMSNEYISVCSSKGSFKEYVFTCNVPGMGNAGYFGRFEIDDEDHLLEHQVETDNGAFVHPARCGAVLKIAPDKINDLEYHEGKIIYRQILGTSDSNGNPYAVVCFKDGDTWHYAYSGPKYGSTFAGQLKNFINLS